MEFQEIVLWGIPASFLAGFLFFFLDGILPSKYKLVLPIMIVVLALTVWVASVVSIIAGI